MAEQPDATYRNWNAYNQQVRFEPGVNVMEAFNILPDPQTNGGLLVAFNEAAATEIQEVFSLEGYAAFLEPIGRLIAREEKTIIVR